MSITNNGPILRKILGQPDASGGEWKFECPKCEERTGTGSSGKKLWVNVTKGRGYCFRCTYGFMNLKQLAFGVYGKGIPTDIQDLLENTAVPDLPEGLSRADLRSALLLSLLANRDEDYENLATHDLPDEYEPIWEYLRPDNRPPFRLAKGVVYAKRRGLTYSKAKEYGLGYCASGHYENRLVFPLRMFGKQTYFTTRYCGDHPVKSLNPPNIEGHYTRRHVLLNYDNVVGQPVVSVAEGPLSAAAHKHGVALFGKTANPQQIALFELLVEQGLKEAVVSLDPDAAKYADLLREQLLPVVPRVTILHLAQGDPDDNKEQIETLMTGRAPRLDLRTRVLARARAGTR